MLTVLTSNTVFSFSSLTCLCWFNQNIDINSLERTEHRQSGLMKHIGLSLMSVVALIVDKTT